MPEHLPGFSGFSMLSSLTRLEAEGRYNIGVLDQAGVASGIVGYTGNYRSTGAGLTVWPGAFGPLLGGASPPSFRLAPCGDWTSTDPPATVLLER